ncbi:MAG: hypothetical protein AAF655_07585, partial [Bacteroidota bacterium]
IFIETNEMAKKELEKLPGISFMVDEETNRIVIVLDQDKYGEAWQDFYDGLLLEMTDREEIVTLEELKAEYKAEGKI